MRLVKPSTNPNAAVTEIYQMFFDYDEAGNRVRKRVYFYQGQEPEPIFETDNLQGWDLMNDEYYSRDVSGKEIAIYHSTSLYQWNVWGTDNVGKITANGDKFFYLKDHLGTIRVVLDASNNIVSANDYDPWGYPLDGRSYQSNNTDYKFTGKQRDTETGWDYFGARYYDARIASWGSVDPLFEKHIQWTPYNYVLRSPMVLIDPEGKQAIAILGGYGGLKNGGKEIQNYSEKSSVGSDVLAAKVNKYLNDNRERFPKGEIKEYYSSYSGREVTKARNYIKKHMKDNPNDKIVIYGYSMGGVRANELAKKLNKEDGYNNITLITVDAYCPPKSILSHGLTISKGVDVNYNYYQDEITSITMAHGGENEEEDPNSTKIFNVLIYGQTHESIDEYVNDEVLHQIKNAIYK